jgi:predicted RNA-binding protein with PUA-like domain
MANYFLAKSDPETYGIDHLIKDKETNWDGIHNFQAINEVKKVKKGDLIYVYHSQKEKAVVGLMQATSDAYKNEKDPRTSWAVDVKFVKKFDKNVTLEDFKKAGSFDNFALVRQGRLSFMEIPDEARKFIEYHTK